MNVSIGAKHAGIFLVLIATAGSRDAAAQKMIPSIVGAEVRARSSGNLPWERGIAEAITDTALVLRQPTGRRVLPRDSVALFERNEGKDRAMIVSIALIGSVVGFIVGDDARGHRQTAVPNAAGNTSSGFLGAAAGIVAGGLLGLRFVPDRWTPIDVGLVFNR